MACGSWLLQDRAARALDSATFATIGDPTATMSCADTCAAACHTRHERCARDKPITGASSVAAGLHQWQWIKWTTNSGTQAQLAVPCSTCACRSPTRLTHPLSRPYTHPLSPLHPSILTIFRHQSCFQRLLSEFLDELMYLGRSRYWLQQVYSLLVSTFILGVDPGSSPAGFRNASQTPPKRQPSLSWAPRRPLRHHRLPQPPKGRGGTKMEWIASEGTLMGPRVLWVHLSGT